MKEELMKHSKPQKGVEMGNAVEHFREVVGSETTPTPDLTDLVAAMGELYELSDGGKAEWWDEDIYWSDEHDTWMLRTADHDVSLLNQHAHDILTAHAERWLRARGWNKIHLANEGEARWWIMGEDGQPLADAIRAEMGRGGNK